MPTQRQESSKRQGGGGSKLTDGQRNQGGDQASESHQQKREGRGNHQTFATSHVIGARFPNVEVEWNLARQFELRGRITAPQLILKRGCPLVKLRNERLHWTLG